MTSWSEGGHSFREPFQKDRGGENVPGELWGMVHFHYDLPSNLYAHLSILVDSRDTVRYTDCFRRYCIIWHEAEVAMKEVVRGG